MAVYDLLTMQEVAKKLGVSLKTVYRWIDSGELPVSYVGKRTYRIFERDFIEFVYSKQKQGEKNK
ncbi:MAG: helix-turn-helix domain-containing protein [Candidatus Buchananbacteria bacterium]|nr:helix-turn-helix domain-containing protein [Candidatus Buchananbacteria bacterium]